MPSPSVTRTEPVPIAAEILKEIESFEEEAAKVLNAELSSDTFRPFRLQHGIYGQRQPGVQMVRIKIPFGGLNATQLRAIADHRVTHLSRAIDRQSLQWDHSAHASVSSARTRRRVMRPRSRRHDRRCAGSNAENSRASCRWSLLFASCAGHARRPRRMSAWSVRRELKWCSARGPALS
jgi:hypothetical protein